MKSTSTTAAPRRRSRAETVRANDIAIRNSVLGCVAEEGWDAMALTGVAKRANLTVGAVYTRAESKSELGNIVWSAAVEPWLSGAVDRILTAAERGDTEALREAFDHWEGDPDMGANAVEFLIASLFDDELDEVVGTDTRRIMERLRRPQPGPADFPAHVIAANTLTMSMALGRLLARRSHPELPALTDQQLEVTAARAEARAEQPRPSSQPLVTFLRDSPADDEQTRIDTAALEVMGRVGYRRATVARIARAAGMSTGMLFSHYNTKAQLVSEAVDRLLKTPVEMWDDYAPATAEYGPLVSRAMWVSDVLNPVNARLWALNLELARVGRFIPELADLQAGVEGHHHTNLGVMLVGSFGGDLHHLPFEDPFSAGSTTR